MIEIVLNVDCSIVNAVCSIILATCAIIQCKRHQRKH